MSKPAPVTYKTTNWPAYNEALKRRGWLTIWFDPEMRWDAAPTGKRGRRQIYSDDAVQTCLTMKVLFGMALRQTTGFVQSLLRLVGLDWTVPDFSTLSRRQKTLAVKIPYRGSGGPLHLLVDSTGIKVEGEGALPADRYAIACRAANGTRASMAAPNGVSGARSTSGSTSRRWRSGRSRVHWRLPLVRKSQWTGTTSAMRQCSPICSARSHLSRRSAASPQTAPTTRAIATMLSRIEAPTPSFRPAEMPNPGSRPRLVRWHVTRPCECRNTSGERSGEIGVDTTAEAVPRQR